MSLMTPIDDFDRAAAAVTRIINAVRPEQLGLPTACTEWDVRAVINHLVQGNVRTMSWANGEQPPPESDYLADDFRVAFTESVRKVRVVLGRPDLAERMVEVPFGTVPGALLVHMRINEYIAHAWDIADATGQSTDIEPDLAEQALTGWRQRFGSMPRAPGGPFGPECRAPDRVSAA